ncbi:MAG: SlyX family protein [Pseudomonadota bacterium]
MSKIEEKLAHLERVTDELSEVIARQDAEIARLTKQVQMLMEREAGRDADGGVILGDERPPHY